MIEVTELRKQTRVCLSTQREDELMPEAFLKAALENFFNRPVPVAEVLLALRWNEARGWAERRWNKDHERDEWKLTSAGYTKEGL